MNTNDSWLRTLRTIIALTVGGLLVWMGLLAAGWHILRLSGVAADFWGMTSALSTAVAVATVLVAGFFAYRELNEAANTRYMEVADRLFEALNSEESIEARRWVFLHLPSDPSTALPTLSDEGHEAIKRVLNSLDRVAFLTQRGWIPEEMVMPWMNPMVWKAWTKLKPWVEYESQRRNEPDYYRGVRELGERCLAWRAQRGLPLEVTWVDHSL